MALGSLDGSPLTQLTSLAPPFEGKEQVNLLAMGIDDGRGGRGRSDTMLLVRVDTRARQVSALSIPRDTRVPLGGGRFIKVNSAYARGGAPLAARVVRDLTGMPVDYTVCTDFAGFRRLVDLVGGIELEVEQPMEYVDHWGGLRIHLQPGLQHLDGDKAVQYVRFRRNSSGGGDGSDISRIARQQKFMLALAARCTTGSNLVRLPELVRESQRQIRTDLSTTDLLYLAGLAKEIGAGRLNVVTVPGKTELVDGQSYWLPDRPRLAKMIQEWTEPPARGTAPVSVAVLNGSRQPGLGRRVAAQLARRGYRIAVVGNSKAPTAESRVIAAERSRGGAEAIADLLECECSIGTPVPPGVSEAQVTVVVGRDLAVEPDDRRG
jgi:LCP family protein required for cell wall assembly